MKIRTTPVGAEEEAGQTPSAANISIALLLQPGTFDSWLPWPFEGTIKVTLMDAQEFKHHETRSLETAPGMKGLQRPSRQKKEAPEDAARPDPVPLFEAPFRRVASEESTPTGSTACSSERTRSPPLLGFNFEQVRAGTLTSHTMGSTSADGAENSSRVGLSSRADNVADLGAVSDCREAPPACRAFTETNLAVQGLASSFEAVALEYETRRAVCNQQADSRALLCLPHDQPAATQDRLLAIQAMLESFETNLATVDGLVAEVAICVDSVAEEVQSLKDSTAEAMACVRDEIQNISTQVGSLYEALLCIKDSTVGRS
ncbi:TNF receptor-associated factor 6 [Elysia marginata]|uniref:TNF receptor-associated factor 6 n=1 Tax=Elysia marginata TaxID=1093978 RepID=A0AAV4GU78_9GAST|nr:TNF receptor-associated factor 6 [Elysia marginata]